MAVVKGILVPTDFSSTSGASLKCAIGLAQTLGARLVLLHVTGNTGQAFEAAVPFGSFEIAARERLLLSDDEVERVRPEYAVRIGTPAEEIARYAEDREIDLIVMGTHGRSGMAHLLLGSVAEQVVRAAPCPILLVRHPKGTALHTSPVAVHAATIQRAVIGTA